MAALASQDGPGAALGCNEAEIFWTNSSSSSASEVADGPEIEPFFRPMADIVALDRRHDFAGMFGAQALCDEQIDDVLAALVDHRGHRLAIDIVEASAQQRKALRRQVDDRRRHVELAVEPRLDRMLIAGFHVHQVSGLQRADMRRHHFVGDGLVLVAADDGEHQARGQRRGYHRAGGEAAEECPPRRPSELTRRDDLGRRLRQRRLDARAQARGRGFFQSGSGHRVVQRAEGLQSLGAGRAGLHMRFDVAGMEGVEFAVDQCVQQHLAVKAVHGDDPCAACT